MALEYWPCYHSYRKKCEKLTDQELGRLVRSLMIYSETGERQELAGRESIAFDFIADDIDRARDKYDARCEQNRENRNQRSSTTVNDRQRTITTDDERDQSKTKSKDKDKSKINIPPVPTAPACENPGLARVMSFFLDRINPAPSPTCIDLLRQYTESLSAGVVLHAMEIAIDERKTAWSYIQAILAQYERDGIRDMDGVKRREQERQQRREAGQAPTRRMSKGEQVAAMGRNRARPAGELRALLDELDKI